MVTAYSKDEKTDALIKKMLGLGIFEPRSDGTLGLTEKFSTELVENIVFKKIDVELAALVTLVDFYIAAHPESDIPTMFVVLLDGWIKNLPDHLKKNGVKTSVS